MKEILEFLTQLAANNNRPWFNAHKDRYLIVKERVEVLTACLINGIAGFDPSAARMVPSQCLYRIYRDTRFSLDKTPYKDHIGIYICPPLGKKDGQRAGYYLHLQPGNCMVAGGAWCPDRDRLHSIRTDIYENVEEYLGIIENPEFKRFYPTVGEDLLKTAPKGFPKEWEHIALLRPRNYTVMTPLSDSAMCSPEMLDLVLERMKPLKPFNDFLNYAMDSDE